MVKTTKTPRKTSLKSTTKKVGAPSKKKTTTFLKSLPESVEHIEIVQQVAGVLEELQRRVIDVKEEASKELKKLMKLYESNYKGLEKKVHQVTFEAKKQAQTSMIHLLQKWHEHKEKLPKPLAKEIEKIIEQIGTRMVSQKPAKKSSTRKVEKPKKMSKARSVTVKTKTSKKVIKATKTGLNGRMDAKNVTLISPPKMSGDEQK